MGRMVARSTSTTRLAFSCMTPMRIQVVYCVSMTKTRMTPITDAPLTVCVFAAGSRLWTGTGLVELSRCI